MSVALIHIISDALSWKLWDPVVEEIVIARKELQGIPVRDGEIEFMQSLFPEGMLVATSMMVIAMFCTHKKFKSA